jgi:hypothetical protein
MSEPIFGQEYWKTEVDEKGNPIIGEDGNSKRKPVRVSLTDVVPMSELEVDRWGKPGRTMHFMAMVVYNWTDGKFQIFESTSKQVNAGIKALVDNEDWGNPMEYDITVTKTGAGRETKYSVMPGSKKAMPENIVEEYSKQNINLEALFTGENPFAVEGEESDKLPF